MGSVVLSMVVETALVAREIYRHKMSFTKQRGMTVRHTARMTSLSSIVLRASETASPTLTPVFLSSSAAARKRGFSLILEVNYNENLSNERRR